ncbi:MAG: phosphomannomutase, partial [Gammaproteobacteria bacterium]|nr:phosphomannomutase [Gammaproteobacteria bacterium]
GVPVNLGYLPTPALALFALKRGIPGVMVTGSHIPDDRNGIKFYQPGGEILKPDEAGIRQRQVLVPGSEFDAAGMYRAPFALPAETGAAYREYCDRYLDFFPAACFHGLRIGLYEHSSVARDLLGEIL